MARATIFGEVVMKPSLLDELNRTAVSRGWRMKLVRSEGFMNTGRVNHLWSLCKCPYSELSKTTPQSRGALSLVDLALNLRQAQACSLWVPASPP
jgi:hypothetical protein